MTYRVTVRVKRTDEFEVREVEADSENELPALVAEGYGRVLKTASEESTCPVVVDSEPVGD